MLADKLHKRIEYVDILKGIGIICVLLGHNLVVQDDGQLPEIMRYIIYSFHMPLFFFLSGYVFSTKVNWTNFIKKKIKTIVVPMYIFSLVIMIFNILYYGLLLGDNSLISFSNIKIKLVSNLLGLEIAGQQPILWFLPCLFSTQIILFVLIRLSGENDKKLIAMLAVLYCIGVINIKTVDIKFLFMIERSFIAVFFVGIGYIFKRNNKNLIEKAPQYILYILTAIWIFALTVKYRCFGFDIEMMVDAKNNFALQVIVSMSAIWALMILFRNSGKIKGISYIGRNSIIYYGLGDMLTFIPKIILYNILKINLSTLGNYSVIFSVFITVLVCFILWPISWVINNKMGIIVGKRNIKCICKKK